jgi:hypothetical protein
LKIRHLVIAALLLTALVGCDPEAEGSEPTGPKPPEGSIVYKVNAKTYQMTSPDNFSETNRRIYVEIDTIDSQGGHGTWYRLVEKTAREPAYWESGPYPYRSPEQTPWVHPIYVGGPVPIITGEAIITLRDVNIGDRLECWIQRNGLEVRNERKSVTASQRGDLRITCTI